MLAKQLKDYLSTVPDDAEILIYIHKIGEVRHLVQGDLKVGRDNNIIIDAELSISEALQCLTDILAENKR